RKDPGQSATARQIGNRRGCCRDRASRRWTCSWRRGPAANCQRRGQSRPTVSYVAASSTFRYIESQTTQPRHRSLLHINLFLKIEPLDIISLLQMCCISATIFEGIRKDSNVIHSAGVLVLLLPNSN